MYQTRMNASIPLDVNHPSSTKYLFHSHKLLTIYFSLIDRLRRGWG